MDLESGRVFFGEMDLTGLDGVLVKKIAAEYKPEHLDRLEHLRFLASEGVRIFSCPERIGGVLNRLTCTVKLRTRSIPMPPTVITEDVDEAVRTVERFERAVLKPLFSSKARGMRVIEAGANAGKGIREFKESGHPVMYIQKMLDLNSRDLALAFLGGQYLGAYARVGNKDSWNTTTRSGGKYHSCEPDADIVELAHRAQEPFGLDFTSVDIAECDGGPYVFEVSAFGGFRGLQEACGIDAAELYVDYALDRLRDG
jgi:ribosomal protein S6--L-glutamate ligase